MDVSSIVLITEDRYLVALSQRTQHSTVTCRGQMLETWHLT